jgi:hypothetical protein
MGDFADSIAVVLGIELLTPAAAGRLSPALPAGEQLLQANLYGVCELVAGRAACASSARGRAARSTTSFCDALRDELGRRPVVADVTADAIVAYSREQERHGGRGGELALPATRRVHLTMPPALLTQLGPRRADWARCDPVRPAHRLALLDVAPARVSARNTPPILTDDQASPDDQASQVQLTSSPT